MSLFSNDRAGGGVARQRGFSLLEVLVAFLILALVLGVAMEIFSGGLQNIDVAGEYQRAIGLAQNKLVVLGIEAPVAEGETRGVFDDKYRWQVSTKVSAESQKSVATALPVTLYEIEVKVSWGESVNPRSLTLKTMRLANKAAS